MFSNILKKSVYFGLVFALILTCGFIAPQSSVFEARAMSASELKNQIEEYEQEQQEIENKIDNLQDDKNQSQQLMNEIENKISNLQDQIDLVNSQIWDLEEQIEEAEAQIDEKTQAIEDTKELLKERLKAIYIAGTNNTLQVLLSAEDLSDFLAKAELMRGVSDHDTQLMETMNDELVEIKQLKADVENKKEETDSLKQTLVAKQNELDDEYDNAQSTYNSYVSEESDLESEAEKIEAQKAQLQAEWEEAIRAAAQSEPNRVLSSMDFVWPYAGGGYISCGYGGYAGHTGTDITSGGAYGTPIYAIADGVVIRSRTLNYSYGYHMIINHGNIDGNNYASLYAHCSALLVSEGEEVTKGQVIGYVGSTGNSSGAHLHFEIRVNSYAVNPMQFYSGY